ncbi:MAG: SPOR domain-containing protein [Alphaproteobacteria bacterium]
MTQRPNPYLQNRFEDTDQPTTPRRTSAPRRAPINFRIKERLMQRFTANPILAATALLFAGAAFGGILIASYPDGNDSGDVPMIEADASPFRELTTTDTATAEGAGRDSTIYSTLREQGTLKETAPIENLLEQEEPVERPAPTQASNTQAAAETTTLASAEPTITTAKTVETATPSMPPGATMDSTNTISTTPEAAPLQHAAGESPDTLAFVQSVLDKKDGRSVADAPAVGPSFNEVTPASGGTFAPGSYYVQLGSVTSRNGADTEFKKMQKNFAGTGLESASYRVQEATVADKGTFYRIQAGPMSKESAGKLCDSIKAKSPGGCLIVQP